MNTNALNTDAAAIKTKWRLAQAKAHSTATWAKTMTQVIISQNNKAGPIWHVINFLGPGKAESRGIVDLLAIRKSHKQVELPFKRGDLFEMILIQVKGGSAKRPSADERQRLKLVAETYGAGTILLSEWKKGSKARFFKLNEDEWSDEIDPAEAFGQVKTAAKKAAVASSVKSSAAKKAWASRKASASAA